MSGHFWTSKQSNYEQCCEMVLLSQGTEKARHTSSKALEKLNFHTILNYLLKILQKVSEQARSWDFCYLKFLFYAL